MSLADDVVDTLVEDADILALPALMDLRRIPVAMLRKHLHDVGNDWDRFAVDVANIKRISALHKIGDDYFIEVLWPDGTEDKMMVEI